MENIEDQLYRAIWDVAHEHLRDTIEEQLNFMEYPFDEDYPLIVESLTERIMLPYKI